MLKTRVEEVLRQRRESTRMRHKMRTRIAKLELGMRDKDDEPETEEA